MFSRQSKEMLSRNSFRFRKKNSIFLPSHPEGKASEALVFVLFWKNFHRGRVARPTSGSPIFEFEKNGGGETRDCVLEN
jgi:hypothetical protein